MADLQATGELAAGATAASPTAVATPSAADYPPASQAYWALFVFALSLAVNFTDRGILNLLVEPIKRDLHLSDLQVSLLMGFAFVFFYILLGFPIATLVDTKSRRAIIGVGLTCWGAMTALCGVAQNFWTFFLCRVGVGVGEACTGPATFSMLSDFFPPHRLTRAIAFMSFGTMAGIGLAQIFGAGIIQMLSGVPNLHVPLIGTIHNWQLVFFVVGIPGLAVALLMTTVTEPPRRGRMTKTAAKHKTVPWAEVLRFFAANWKCYGPMFIALAVGALSLSGAAAWGIVFYQRTYHWSAPQTGYVLGTLAVITGPIGLMLGTALAEHYAKRGFDDANMRVARWVSVLALPWGILGPLMPSPWLAVAMTAIGAIIGGMAGAPLNAALQVVTPNEMRGRITAMFLFIFNVIGSGLGPTFIASFTDIVFHDEAKLRYALALSAVLVGPIAAACYWWGMKHYREAVVRAKSWA